jgi:hypothetical protein
MDHIQVTATAIQVTATAHLAVYRSRLAPEVVQARQQRCEQCLKETIVAGTPISTSSPLLAFLNVPAEMKSRFEGHALPEYPPSPLPPPSQGGL